MKTDIEIKDDVYAYIASTELPDVCSGVLSKRKRPLKSQKEDIVISVLANNMAQEQSAYVNVNIYVKDNFKDGQYEERSDRLRIISKICLDIFKSYHGKDFWISLEPQNSQRILEVSGANEHVINNKILYKLINE